MPNELELRCFCSRHTLLAMCGRDLRTGIPYIHIKSTKSGKIVTEAIVTSGVVRIRCRECLRWHTVKITQGSIKQAEEKLPAGILV